MRPVLTILFLLFFNVSFSQIQTPRISPASNLKQTVGLTDIEINYNRPSKRGRVVFGNLVPYGKIWRTGANSGTELTFSTDVTVAGSVINAGTYTLFTIPNEESWEVMLYSQTDLWSVPRDWDESKIIFRSSFDANVSTDGDSMETFSIWIGNVTNNDCHLNMGWDNTVVNIKIDVPTKEIVEKSILSVLDGPEPKASDYYAAAVYYREENMKMDKALVWMKKFVEMTDQPRFFHLRQYALILAANKDFMGAVNVSRRSLRLSMQADNQDYVKMNTESIAEWSKEIR